MNPIMNNYTTSPKPKNASNTIATVTPEHSNTDKTKARKVTNLGPFRIRVERKSEVKRLCDMASPSSTFAVVNNYKSIIDALDVKRNCELDVSPDFRAVILQHFDMCSMFRTNFKEHLTKSTSIYFQNETPTLSVLERSFHLSVRHICDRACFLRAYSPIRELAFLWRDLIIDEIVDERSLTKPQVLNGWMCQLVQPAPADSKPPLIDIDDATTTVIGLENVPGTFSTFYIGPFSKPDHRYGYVSK